MRTHQRDLLCRRASPFAKLNFGDRVGPVRIAYVKAQGAEILAIVLVWARIIHLDLGQPTRCFYHRVLAGTGNLFFRPPATAVRAVAHEGKCEQSGRTSEEDVRIGHNARYFRCADLSGEIREAAGSNRLARLASYFSEFRLRYHLCAPCNAGNAKPALLQFYGMKRAARDTL